MKADEHSLREKQAAATQDHILNAAFRLLVEHPEQPFSHESVARAASVGARTVYRHFPAQADLYEALWLRVREQSGTVFPNAEDEIISHLRTLYSAFDQNEKLIRAVMESSAGARVRARGTVEGRTGFNKSLKNVTHGKGPAERRQIRAVFLGIHSGPFWQMLRDRGGLSGPEAIAAASWAAQTLLNSLRGELKTSIGDRHLKKQGEQST